MLWLLPSFLYALSLAVASLTMACASVLAFLAVSEFLGANLRYSKFGGKKGGGGAALLVPSRVGMLIIYAPTLAAALASFTVQGAVEGIRVQILATAVTVHFLKRVLEVMFMHRYSGSTPVGTVLLILSYYFSVAAAMIYMQHLSHGLPEPAVDLLYPGVLAFAVGITGNFYHHLLLSRLRSTGGDNNGYKIPRGGLFELIICPHYLFEIIVFFGFGMISQTVYALVVAVGTVAYLACRSYASRKWYVAKFEFPARVKALVPYVW